MTPESILPPVSQRAEQGKGRLHRQGPPVPPGNCAFIQGVVRREGRSFPCPGNPRGGQPGERLLPTASSGKGFSGEDTPSSSPTPTET